MPVLDIKKSTMELIRQLDPQFSDLADDKLAFLYSSWSEMRCSASWLTPSKESVKAFITWATSSPLELISK